ITGSSGLTKDEVERLRKDAEVHAEEDRKTREAAETRNTADNLAYQCEKQLAELGEKLSSDQKKGVEDAIKEVREKLNGTDVDAIKKATEELQSRFQGISAELYKQAASQKAGPQPADVPPGSGQSGSTGSSTKSDENVVDADFEVVDDDKKKS
ncbi:MAG: Hsp70 family protein, partial [Verrucomicrobia bacterium]|nr:Hsp70 family protein [Verrucomicrobiota bacterium]